MNYIDAHCHLNLDTLPADVAVAITNATQISDWENIVPHTGQGGIYGAIGVHPWYISDLPADWMMRMQKLLVENPKLMVGETGLDKNRPDMATQMKIFSAQLKLAVDLGRAVHIHCVGAWDKLFTAMEKYTPHAIVIHGFDASPEIVARLLKYNTYFSFGDAICNPMRKRAQNALTVVPQNRILSESDSGAPDSVAIVVQKMAEILSCPLADMAQTIYNNTMELLKK